jgi:hypothetical protein
MQVQSLLLAFGPLLLAIVEQFTQRAPITALEEVGQVQVSATPSKVQDAGQ